MPVGTNFENSAMKASFSLSSLQSPDVVSPDKGVKPRQFNSLTKKRIKSASVRRSWGSSASEQRDDFWSALQANYNYIMDNQLIDKCQEANSDLLGLDKNGTWTLNEFFAQYSELDTLLNTVQEMIYGREENITDKSLRLKCQSMVMEKRPSINLFSEQASQLVQLRPEIQEEVTWRVTYLNSKWDSILHILGPSDCKHCDQEICIDIDHEIMCLRKWINDMEIVLQPLDLKTKFTKTEIETKALELKVLHRDIENHGKIVSSVVRLCKKSDSSCNRLNIRRIANGLERRWQILYLSSLEWQCHLDSLSKHNEHITSLNNTSDDSDSECCEGPSNKYQRLTEEGSPIYSATSNKNVNGSINQDVLKSERLVMNSETLIPPQHQPFGRSECSLFTEDTSHYTKSDRKAQNLGTFYFKHEDTDSERDRTDSSDKMDKEANGSAKEDQSGLEETSEEECTYTQENVKTEGNRQNCNEAATTKIKSVPEDTIKKLVQEAEDLVSPDKSKKHVEIYNSVDRVSKVKKWLDINKTEDSCDASAEEDERDSSQDSDDLEESLATFRENRICSSQNASLMELHAFESTPKVQMRQRKHMGNRPWSVSCDMKFESPASINATITALSSSESALHSMNLISKSIQDYNNTLSLQTIGGIGNNSTSSTMDESGTILAEEKTSPNRRHRMKMRRKVLKNCNKSNNKLYKSSSYAGNSNNASQSERQTSSDPQSVSLFNYNRYETTTTSGAETDDSICRRVPIFKVGHRTQYLSDPRDTSPGKSSLNTTEEQSSSLSEQAWDSYQEKYFSEAYSETHDSDAARKLLDFGEDYRVYFDSPSDWSTIPDFSPTFRRRNVKRLQHGTEDSESESEFLKKNLLDVSKNYLEYTKDMYKKEMRLGQSLELTEIAKLKSTCDQHIDILSTVISSSDVPREDKRATTELLEGWKNLRSTILTMMKLHKEILELKHILCSYKIPQCESMFDVGYVDDLENEVCELEHLLSSVKKEEKELLRLNIDVNRFVVENKEYNASSLKNEFTSLYSTWTDLHTTLSSRLSALQPLLERWKTVESRLEQLQGDLESDKKTLSMLHSALTRGSLSEETATYVRDVAKVLSEANPSQGCTTIPELFTEGSLSDSGISDEGSEHDIGEREKRLSAIKRLVRQLEVVLSPDSNARVRMADRLTSTEEELKALRKRCKSLIVKSAVCTTPPGLNEEDKQLVAVKAMKTRDDGGEPDSDPSDSSWLRRAVRASVPIQLVLVTILCIAWLLEPQCCDNMNNYSWGLSPQLRYINGPPPI